MSKIDHLLAIWGVPLPLLALPMTVGWEAGNRRDLQDLAEAASLSIRPPDLFRCNPVYWASAGRVGLSIAALAPPGPR